MCPWVSPKLSQKPWHSMLTHIRAYSGALCMSLFIWTEREHAFYCQWQSRNLVTVTMCWPEYKDLIYIGLLLASLYFSKFCRSRNDGKLVYSREVELYAGESRYNSDRRIARCSFTSIAELNAAILAKWGKGSKRRILFQRSVWLVRDTYDPWMELTDLSDPKQLPWSLLIKFVEWITGSWFLGQKVKAPAIHIRLLSDIVSVKVVWLNVWMSAWHADHTNLSLSWYHTKKRQDSVCWTCWWRAQISWSKGDILLMLPCMGKLWNQHY